MADTFIAPGQIISGNRALDMAAGTVAKLGKKALVVTDDVMRQLGNLDKVTDMLMKAGVSYAVFTGVSGEPDDRMIQAGVAVYREENCDFLVGLGGGSPIDSMKAIAMIAAWGGRPADYMGRTVCEKPAPMAAIPTTAGTGSEATQFTIITDTATQVKMLLKGPGLMPDLAVIDPQFTMTAPPGITAATGVDALTHAIEGYITPGAWSLSDCLSMQTIRMIAKNLAKSADGDVPAGEQMAYASYITGMAYSNVGLGLVHGMAHPLGGRLGVAHGVANGILLAPVMEYNKDFTGEKYRDIADAFGIEDAYTGDLEKVREEAVQAVHQLTVDLKNPTTISEVGATEADLAPLAHDAFNDVCTPGNPRKATEEDILKIYTSLM